MPIRSARSSSSRSARRRSRRGRTSPCKQQTVTRSWGRHSFELSGATCWVPEGWSGETNDDGTLVLTR